MQLSEHLSPIYLCKRLISMFRTGKLFGNDMEPRSVGSGSKIELGGVTGIRYGGGRYMDISSIGCCGGGNCIIGIPSPVGSRSIPI